MTVVDEQDEERYKVLQHDMAKGGTTKTVAYFPHDREKRFIDGEEAIFDAAHARATTFCVMYEQMSNRGDLDRLSQKSIVT